MPSNCKCAIFDNDGTLMESMYFWRLGALEYMIAHRLPIPGKMTLEELFSCTSREFRRNIAQEHGEISFEEMVCEMEERMARHYRYDVREKPGVAAFLARLQAQGMRMCVATAAPRELCEEARERLGLRGYFEFVLGRHDMALGKDDPEYFRQVASRLGAACEDCWVFEDALYAVKGAKAAGMRVCAVGDYTAMRQRAEIRAAADAYIDDYLQTEAFDAALQ